MSERRTLNLQAIEQQGLELEEAKKVFQKIFDGYDDGDDADDLIEFARDEWEGR